MKALHKQFVDQENLKIGFSTFCRLRPSNLVPMKFNKLSQCLCEICENLNLKLEAIKTKIFFSKNDILLASLCNKAGILENERACIYRECDDCGILSIRHELEKALRDMDIIEWKEWKLVEQPNGQKRKTIVHEKDSSKEFIDKLCIATNEMSLHMFTALWQYNQYNCIRNNPSEGEVVIGMDFAENYRTTYQREVTSAHWSYQQITVHPMVTHYRCPEVGCHTVIKDAIIAVSNDLNHDSFAVNAFINAAKEHLVRERKINIDKLVYCSDQCAVQYKSKVPFYLLSTADHPVIHSFFGTGHGKSLMDGEGAVVKSHITKKVMSREIIVETAEQFVDACKEFENKNNSIHEQHLSKQAIRKVILVNDINRFELPDIKTIKGTRKFHCVKNMPETEGHIEGRQLSCFCEGCRTKGTCENTAHGYN